MSESFDAFVYTISRNLTYNFLRDASKKESLKKELWEAIKMEQYHTENIFKSAVFTTSNDSNRMTYLLMEKLSFYKQNARKK